MELFILNDVDYTSHIQVPSYKVQREEITKEWEDALYTKHQDLLRYQIKGSFNMYFDDVNELYEFLDLIENMREVDNYITATFYDNKTHSQKTSKYKINFNLQNDMPYYGLKNHSGFTVNIEEK